MMKTMRQNMKGILWVLILAFIATIVFSWGMGGFKGGGPQQGILAVINGVDITVDKFEDLIQQRYQFEKNKQEEDLSDYQVKQIRTEVWDELIRNILVEQEVAKLGIKVSDKEIAYMVQHNPPDFIRQSEYFQTEGFFDMSKYEEFLRNPAAARDLVLIEQNYRQNLPNQKLLNRILALATVTDQEAWQKFTDDNLTVKARYVLFDAADSEIDSAVITQKQIGNYYFAHKEEYSIPEKRRIIYTIFKEESSAADSADVLDLANEIINEIENGADFAELAKIYSEDRSGANGGDLGWFEKGRMLPEFEEVAFALEKDEISEPVLSKFGYHIIKKTGKKWEDGQEMIQASHILLKIQPSADTRDLIRNTATGFTDEIRESDFATAVETYQVEVDTSDYFERRDVIPGLGRMPAAVDFIFNSPVGEAGPTYPVRDGLLVFNIHDLQKERTQKLSEVKSQVFADLYKEARIEAARQKTDEFYQGLTDPEQFKSLAEEAGYTVNEIDREFRFDAYVSDVGRDLNFTAAALALEVGEVSAPVKAQKGYYLIQLTEKSELDSTEFLEKSEELRSQLLTAKQNQFYQKWIEATKENAKIEDYRYLYYRDY